VNTPPCIVPPIGLLLPEGVNITTVPLGIVLPVKVIVERLPAPMLPIIGVVGGVPTK
jgi:hypothetical protein